MEIKDPCGGCGATTYHYWRVTFASGERYENCSECSKTSTPGLSPDVFFDKSKGSFQIDPNLCERNGNPVPFSSKREKAAIMKRLGLREAGDKEHGGRNFDRHSQQNNWQ